MRLMKLRWEEICHNLTLFLWQINSHFISYHFISLHLISLHFISSHLPCCSCRLKCVCWTLRIQQQVGNIRMKSEKPDKRWDQTDEEPRTNWNMWVWETEISSESIRSDRDSEIQIYSRDEHEKHSSDTKMWRKERWKMCNRNMILTTWFTDTQRGKRPTTFLETFPSWRIFDWLSQDMERCFWQTSMFNKSHSSTAFFLFNQTEFTRRNSTKTQIKHQDPSSEFELDMICFCHLVGDLILFSKKI